MSTLQRGAGWAEERLLGDLRQSVPQNGRVHLHIIDKSDSRVAKTVVEKLTFEPLLTLSHFGQGPESHFCVTFLYF